MSKLKHSDYYFIINPEKTSACFFILVELMYGFTYTSLDITGFFHDILLYTALLMAMISLFFRNWETKQLIRTSIMMIIGILVYLIAHETIYIVMILAAILVGDIGYKKTLKIIFMVRLPMLLLVLLCTLLGVFPVGLVMVTKGSYGKVAAYSLGYLHPNVLGQEIYFLCSLYICIRNKNIKKPELLGILAIDIITYLVTRSKTACALIALFSLTAFFYKKLERFFSRHKLLIGRILVIVGVILPVVSILGAYIYPHVSGSLQYILYRLNSTLNGRLANGAIMFIRFPLTMFGMLIDLTTLSRFYSYFIVDNSYIFSLFNFGLIPFSVLIYLYLYSLYRLIQRGEYLYAVNLFLFLMCAVSENVLRAMFVNFSILFCHEFFAKENQLDKFKLFLSGGKNGRKKNPLLLVWRK